ncbi:MAG: methionine ABC transporter ATP-binding protein [Anaerolinea sp.]|nr:methionine ABC transporter ATP-binding protein [Anaerolinea sp.]
MTEPIISVRGLSIRYRTKESRVYAVDDVSFDLFPGQVLTLVGESGSGKTTAGMSILRLLAPEAEVLGGQVLFEGRDLLAMDDKHLRPLRGRRIAMVFQDPVAGLNPVLPVGSQVAEILTSHLEISKKDAQKQALQILKGVGLADAERVAKSYPFQLSGGMCQRVMIGIATALNPDVIIADEPTSALDVTIQAQILHQLDQLRKTRGTAIMLITHDFGVVAQMADQVAVMYAGRVVESGGVMEMLKAPLHPYTHGLLATLPRVDGANEHLRQIPGQPPELTEPSERCPFIPRCPKVLNVCRASGAPKLELPEGRAHLVACYNPIWQAER